MKFLDVYNQYFDYVYNYLRRRLRNAHDAEEVALDTFTAVWKNFESFDKTRSLEAWVFGISKNKLNDFLRKRYRMEEKEIHLGEINIEEWEENTEKDHSKAPKPLLKELVQDLKDIDRQIVQLKYHAGWSFSDIAIELEMTVNNVKVRHNRLIKKLYEQWKERI